MRFPAIRALLVLCLSGALLGLAVPPALAHDSLKSSSPARGAVVSRLDEIELEFSAHPSFPVVILHDAQGKRFEAGEPRVDGPKVFQRVAGQLPPGGYVIAWRVVSSDGHPVEGEIPFTVGGAAGGAGGVPATAGTTPDSAASGTPVAPPAPESGGGVPLWVWAALGLLVVVGAAATLLGRKTSASGEDAATAPAAPQSEQEVSPGHERLPAAPDGTPPLAPPNE
ncbi:copper resistance CopC family protein [Sphaerisporangium fuscum]|uniref:copper resistance CopC family protein n=1 Tax=Sphaerisporangium fuscum TaxID=2835868 RepID=UPI001BDCCE88|nr:copper resistance CopC family protein [Sphaerisporangium fuscum]